MISINVLVLNQNYEPLNVCTARRAFNLLDRGKAEVLEHGAGELRSAHGGVYEYGVAPGAHGVELQPFPDG